MVLSDFFAYMENFPFGEIFENCSEPWEVLARVKSIMTENRIDPSAKIHSTAEIKGPVWVGKNAEIGHCALLRPYSVIGDNCSIGHGSEVKHTVMFNGSKVASLAFVGDSILGKSARIGSGVITANRKFDQSNVFCRGVDLHSDYFGLIMGDYSRIGANSVTQPGTHIGQYTWIFPMTNVRGVIPSNKRVFCESKLRMVENVKIELK